MEKRLNYLVAGAYIALVFVTIIVVTVYLPYLKFQPEASEVATNYEQEDPAVLRGRNVYRREGCFYCHTQFVRYQDRETGEMVAAGDYVHETPHVLGTERTGPDLSNIGGKYPDSWHWAHHVNPRAVKPGSIMPSFSYLSHDDMSDLIAYLQTLGAKRKQPHWINGPQEYRDKYHVISELVDVDSSAAANAGRGIYMQNCAVCHGVQGKGNGPVSATMAKKPANFTRPYYAAYSNDMWYWRVAEGVAGTRMPRWKKSLSDEDMLYLVAFLKTLPNDGSAAAGEVEVTEFSQLDDPNKLDDNYKYIENLGADHGAYQYGGGRPH
ncbi:MAG: cbb3-type cytochrome c oxidase subunit II [Vampirovibrio sp.]|nr:cbb3-type cytochrome c oxidase subunit II [Vampirovibrio sp.]